jgi:hypothetical protein
MTVPTDSAPSAADDLRSPDVPAPPSRPMSTRTKIAAAATTAALLLGGGFAFTHLGGGTTTATAQQGPGAQPGGGMRGQPPAAGTVTAVSATSISVKASSGTVTTYTISSSTRVMDDGATSTVSALKVGDAVVVLTGGPGQQSTTGNAAGMILAGTSATAGPQGGMQPNAQPSAATTT